MSPSQQQARVHYQVWWPSWGQLSAITVITRHSHFLIISYRAHHISAQPQQQLARWPSGGEGCTVVAGGGGGPSLVAGSALPADCYVLQLRSALLSSQFSGLVTRHHRHHCQLQPATACGFRSSNQLNNLPIGVSAKSLSLCKFCH